VTKKSKRAKKPMRLKMLKQRRAFTNLMLGLDDIFRDVLGHKYKPAHIMELRHVYQRIIANHLDGEPSTALGLAKRSGIPRETIRRILKDLRAVRWVVRNAEGYWVSPRIVKLPVMPQEAYARATVLVLAAAKELQRSTKK
jgi:DNA-binding GntR family transcriptional regulator